MNYDTIKEEIKNIDITLPPPQEEPERQYYFIKKMQQYSLLANFNLCFQRIMSAQDEQNG